jgi:hypothetical protein
VTILMIFYAPCVYKYELQKFNLTTLYFIIGLQHRI